MHLRMNQMTRIHQNKNTGTMKNKSLVTPCNEPCVEHEQYRKNYFWVKVFFQTFPHKSSEGSKWHPKTGRKLKMSRIYQRSAQKRHHKNDTKKWKISLKNGSSPPGCIMSFKVLFLFSNFYFYIWLITSFIGENWLGGKFIYTFFYLCFLKFFSKFLLFCSSFLICVSNFLLVFILHLMLGFH